MLTRKKNWGTFLSFFKRILSQKKRAEWERRDETPLFNPSEMITASIQHKFFSRTSCSDTYELCHSSNNTRKKSDRYRDADPIEISNITGGAAGMRYSPSLGWCGPFPAQNRTREKCEHPLVYIFFHMFDRGTSTGQSFKSKTFLK